MANGGHRLSNSTNSDSSDPFYSARSSTEDAEMLYRPTTNRLLTSPNLSSHTFESSHNPQFSNTHNGRHPLVNHGSASPAFPSNLSETSSSGLQNQDPARAELISKGWVFPPNIPINAIKFAIGRRELAMQTQTEQCFDLVELQPYARPPNHTAQTERLKAWHKTVVCTPQCLPHRKQEPEWPHIKVAFGPLGWDQVWAYEMVDLKKVIQNAGHPNRWHKLFQDHRVWCTLHRHVVLYGVQVKFPYGYDITTSRSELGIQNIIRIPANEQVLVPLGQAVAEWGKQVSLRHEHWEQGPTLPYPFNPYDRNQEPPTITLRYKNVHPELPTVPANANPTTNDKGRWTKGWLSTEELTILSSENDTTYLDTVIDGGPQIDPTLTSGTNRLRMLQFWDLESKQAEVVEWLIAQDWMWEHFGMCSRERRGEDIFRQVLGERIQMSLERAVNGLPY